MARLDVSSTPAAARNLQVQTTINHDPLLYSSNPLLFGMYIIPSLGQHVPGLLRIRVIPQSR
jgi:hypothetical protein